MGEVRYCLTTYTEEWLVGKLVTSSPPIQKTGSWGSYCLTTYTEDRLVTDGELQATRSLWMRLGEAYEHWRDMLEKLHELEGNEEKLRTLKVERARDILMHGRLDTRAHLERAFLDES